MRLKIKFFSEITKKKFEKFKLWQCCAWVKIFLIIYLNSLNFNCIITWINKGRTSWRGFWWSIEKLRRRWKSEKSLISHVVSYGRFSRTLSVLICICTYTHKISLLWQKSFLSQIFVKLPRKNYRNFKVSAMRLISWV